MARYSVTKRAKLKSRGLCLRCGVRPSVMGHTKCEPCKGKERRNHLRKSYGLTLEEFDERLAAQGGVCKLCGKQNKKKRLQVDHHHGSGKIRGLLCWRCNYGLHWFSEDPVMFSAVAQYLREGEVA